VRFLVHNVAFAQPTQVNVITLILFVLNLQKALLSILVLSCRS
jgi:hypothetical protein